MRAPLVQTSSARHGAKEGVRSEKKPRKCGWLRHGGWWPWDARASAAPRPTPGRIRTRRPWLASCRPSKAKRRTGGANGSSSRPMAGSKAYSGFANSACKDSTTCRPQVQASVPGAESAAQAIRCARSDSRALVRPKRRGRSRAQHHTRLLPYRDSSKT